ncbi:heliorhodopsin HeR [Halobacteriaceae bacterium SHR40]|uniref:heliorhodopsin HeR n=1 Tax=Halovenus amylolytica TaxID=2500550 RepID=UPI000FE411AB
MTERESDISIPQSTDQWKIIGIGLAGSYTFGESSPPDFVIGIFVSIAVLFKLFAIDMALQYKEVWRWERYLFGEWVYIVLSLVARSALAWQVFAGALNTPV